jgi:aminoglycoside phosphotransferase (APT) family kinase protein
MREVLLSKFQRDLVRSVFPPDAVILRAEYMQDQQRCPIRIDLLTNQGVESVVLRISRNQGGVEREVSVLPALARLGLPVPSVLVEPSVDPDAPELYAMSLMTMLSGSTLQSLASSTTANLDLTCRLFAEAITRMHGVSEAVKADPAFSCIPVQSLLDDFSSVVNRGGDWLVQPLVKKAIAVLRSEVERLNPPLVLSNGDYQPGNFLAEGSVLTGILDFEKARFSDPLASLARLPVYDLQPLARPESMVRILNLLGYSSRELAVRVAIFAIRTLQIKVPVQGGTERDAEWRDYVQGTLANAIHELDV